MDTLLHDIRYALRILRKAPGATAVALVSLAIGISVNTTVFSWIRGVLLNPLPGVVDPGRLATVETVAPSGTLIDSSYPDYRDVRDRATLMSGVIAFKERPLGLGENQQVERVWAMLVSGNYFDVLGVKPALGRLFQGEEQGDAFDSHPVAVLGYAAWKGRFNGDPRIVGRTITLNRHPYTVIGVAPGAFFGTITGLRFDLFVPLTMQASLTGGSQWLESRTSRPLYLMARLKPGASIEQARGEAASIGGALATEFPRSNRNVSFTLLDVANARRGAGQALGPVLRVLMAISGLVLLIVCANVANLQFARATGRQREIGVRLGLGATRGRLVRQLLTEGVVVGAIGGALALVASAWLVDGLRLLLPFAEYPIVLSTRIAGRELAFTAALAMGASVLFSLMPALRASAANVAETLKTGGRQAGDGRAGRMGGLLVVGEVALAMTALVSAGLLVRSFEHARSANVGFDPRGVLLTGVDLSLTGYDRDSGLRFLDRALERARALPGVTAAGLSEDVPLGFDGGSWEDIAIDGHVPAPGESMKIYRNLVAPGYFDLMRIPLLAGRDVTDRDTRDTPAVAIVNETFAQRYFEGHSPIGRSLRAWGMPNQIVGMVADSKYHSLTEAAEPYFYVPLRQKLSAGSGVALQVRTAGDPMQLAPAVRGVLRDLDPQVPVDLMTTLADYTAVAYYPQQLAAMLVGLLGGLALVLSAVGLYSLMAYRVARRRKEIGIRMALGATSTAISRVVVGEGLRLVGIGVAVGAVLAIGAARALAALLFGVGPFDIAALVSAALMLAGVACLASYVPARAASRVNPTSAMRAE